MILKNIQQRMEHNFRFNVILTLAFSSGSQSHPCLNSCCITSSHTLNYYYLSQEKVSAFYVSFSVTKIFGSSNLSLCLPTIHFYSCHISCAWNHAISFQTLSNSSITFITNEHFGVRMICLWYIIVQIFVTWSSKNVW